MAIFFFLKDIVQWEKVQMKIMQGQFMKQKYYCKNSDIEVFFTFICGVKVLTSDYHICGNRHTVHLGLNGTRIFPSMP